MSTDNILKLLRDICGKEYATDLPEERSCYSYDASRRSCMPDYVVKPRTTAEVSQIMKLASQHQIPVYPRGAATGLTGASVPTQGGIAMSLLHMNKIIEIDTRDLIAIVEPGVITVDLQKASEAEGLFYPPDPASYRFCTIGGNVAVSAGGLRGLKYGVTKDYVLGLEAVLPSGEILNLGVRTLKGVVGYDLVRLFVGSEGTLGVVTKVTLKLLPLPEHKNTIEVFFSDVNSAAATVAQIIRDKIIPAALEFMDSKAIECVRSMLQKQVPPGVGALLLIEIDGDPQLLKRQIRQIQHICEINQCIQVNLAADAQERESMWAARRAISPAIYRLGGGKLNEDICVPRSRLPQMLERIDTISNKYDLLIVNFGHAGDGNIHVNVILPHDYTDQDYQRGWLAVSDIFTATLELGGTISGEHGVGLAKADFLSQEIGVAELKLMKDIKRVFDPLNIMNPGKVFTV